MEKKKKVLTGLVISLMIAITMLSGCFEEEGIFHESFMLYVGEERQITRTNYSLILRDSEWVTDTASIEIYRNSEYVRDRIFSNYNDETKRFKISDNLKIVLDDVPKDGSVKVSIYFI